MKTKILSLLLVTAMLLSLLTGMTVMADEVTSLTGSGTEASPYLIGTAAELMFAANQSNSTDATTRLKYAGASDSDKVYYKITADIDMSGYDFPGFARESVSTNSFRGFIYGGGHVISNLTVVGEEGYPAGLICRAANSRIADLGLENVTISGGKNAGAFIGKEMSNHSTNGTLIQSCYVKGLTFGDAVTGTVAGFVGIYDTASGYAKFVNCYSLDVSKGNGFMGYHSSMGVLADMTNCYTSRSQNNPSLTNRSVLSTYKNVSTTAYTLIQANEASVSGSLTADMLKSTAPQTLTGNDVLTFNGFVDDEYDLNDGLPVLAWQTTGLKKIVGKGTDEEPYEIATAEDLMYFANQSNSTDEATRLKYSGTSDTNRVYYRITADIDMTGYNFPGFARENVSTAGFAGFISGGGHVISNLKIVGLEGYPAGLICRAKFSRITDLGLKNVTITGGKNAGAFIGLDKSNHGTSGTVFQSCFVDGVTFDSAVTGNKAGFMGIFDSAYGDIEFVNCYSLNLSAGNGFLGIHSSMGIMANMYNCYTSSGQNNVNKANAAESAYKNVTESSYIPMYAGSAGDAVSAKLTAAELNATPAQTVSATYTPSVIGFVADEFEINGGFPVLAWQNEGRVKDVEPGFVADSTTVIEAADDVDGCPSFIVYGWLNNFNTDATGMEYGMKISDGDGFEEYLPARRKVEDGENITYVPATPVANGQFAIRVYVKGLTSSATYTMTPYIGTAGSYTYGDTSDGHTVEVE